MQILTTAKSLKIQTSGLKGHVWKAGTGIFHEL